MSQQKGLNPENWLDFKTKWTNENFLIAQAISSLLPRDGCDLVLDVGAGLGDIAGLAYPDKDVLLLDVLAFPPPSNPRHQRICQNFLAFSLPVLRPVSMVVFSHSLQYLDDNPALLFDKIEQIAARYIIAVMDEETDFQEKAVAWLEVQGVTLNVERPILGFPGKAYRSLNSQQLVGEIKCDTFAELARQLGCMIYDATMNVEQIGCFAQWLQKECQEPCVEIPQTVTLYVRDL